MRKHWTTVQDNYAWAQIAGTYDELDSATERLGHVRYLRDRLEAIERRMVDRLRDEGETWDRIAQVLGVTRSAVIQRFGQ